MDILAFIANNSEMLLMSLSVVLAFIARYFQQESKVLYDAGQALIALEQEILNSVKDGIVTQDELDTLIIKIQVAEKALQDALAIFVKPASVVQTSRQKIAMLFGVSDVQAKTNVIKEQIVTLKAQRTEKLARMQRRISQQKTP